MQVFRKPSPENSIAELIPPIFALILNRGQYGRIIRVPSHGLQGDIVEVLVSGILILASTLRSDTLYISSSIRSERQHKTHHTLRRDTNLHITPLLDGLA